MSLVVKNERTVRDMSVSLDQNDILELLRAKGLDIPFGAVNVFVTVPGGGDWSHMNLDIDLDTQIQVTWEEVTNG